MTGEEAISTRRQRIVRTRRTYNQWVANETLEDYALRYTAEKARNRSTRYVANAALGSIAFLACEAIGATVTLNYGFGNFAAALALVAAIFLLCGLPICYYGARYGVDMDLLTRGAGFGYLGSTLTSSVYASFTFILFSIEGAILAGALKLCLGLPLWLGYIIAAVIVLPIAAYGFRRIGRLQNWTQPVWLILQCAPLIYLALHGRETLALWVGHNGLHDQAAGQATDIVGFGVAVAVLLSFLPQIGEQVDYLRFLPTMEKVGKGRWWSALLLTGPGWILPGGVKIVIGSVLAVLMIHAGFAFVDAANPTMQYFGVFKALFGNPVLALLLTGLFVVICQVKINVTNAYAGSIASSNFFSRLTHRHPGRVVWLIFNVMVALMLMEFGIQNVVEHILSLYSNFAVAWFGAVTADLVISKPLGLSPRGIEFKRAHLYDVNPVGIGAMALSLVASTLCFTHVFGPVIAVFSPLIGLGTSFVAAPLIAWATKGRYYLARQPSAPAGKASLMCVVCENSFEPNDMAHCPVYAGAICSLCCTLEARCHDACKPGAGVVDQAAGLFRRFIPAKFAESTYGLLARFVMMFTAMICIIALILFLIEQQPVGIADRAALGNLFRYVFLCLVAVSGFAAWYFVLAQDSRRAAEEETERQTAMLNEEIEAHRRTDEALQQAKEVAETANLAKSRYIVGVSHEIRAPLNAIAGYAQLLERDPGLHLDNAVRVIRRSSAHLVHLIEGLVDISRIENRSMRIERAATPLAELLDQIAEMFRLQATAKGIRFVYDPLPAMPSHVFTDEKKLRQIVINLVSNAIKYTSEGEVRLSVRWRNPVMEIEVTDTGVGIAPADLARIFEPFERVGTVREEPGIGLGLTITRMLAEIMGGDITVHSEPGKGSRFCLKMLFSEAPSSARSTKCRITAYTGPRRSVLAADDDLQQLDLLRNLLAPLGFDYQGVGDGEACLAACAHALPDLVILDIAMPGMDGWETARILRATYGDDLTILMISANAHDFQRPRRDDDPHDDYLTKPYEHEALLERIGTLLAVDWAQAEAEATS